MTRPQELRATGARRDERKAAPKRRKRNVAEWKAILADALERGLCASDIARERGVTTQAVSNRTKALGVTLQQKTKGRAFMSTHETQFHCPKEWGLTRQQSMLVAVLVDAEGDVSNDDLLEKISGPYTDPKIVAVVACKTRAKLKPFGVHIETIWGKGLYIAEADRLRLRAGAVYLEQSLERAA